jgi:hypothetical protein
MWCEAAAYFVLESAESKGARRPGQCSSFSPSHLGSTSRARPSQSSITAPTKPAASFACSVASSFWHNDRIAHHDSLRTLR